MREIVKATNDRLPTLTESMGVRSLTTLYAYQNLSVEGHRTPSTSQEGVKDPLESQLAPTHHTCEAWWQALNSEVLSSGWGDTEPDQGCGLLAEEQIDSTPTLSPLREKKMGWLVSFVEILRARSWPLTVREGGS